MSREPCNHDSDTNPQQISQLPPALDKFEQRSYSLEPDMINGWKPKNSMFRQIPICYGETVIDLIIKKHFANSSKNQPKARAPQQDGSGDEDTRNQQDPLEQNHLIVYLGPRFSSNFKGVKAYCFKEYDQYLNESHHYYYTSHTTSVKGSESPQLKTPMKFKRFDLKYYRNKQKIFNNFKEEPRCFTGINPQLEDDNCDIIFDSYFECGNLDAVIKVGNFNYDLFMRVDTNTKGHTNWYYFKARNRNICTVTFNLCNFVKPSLLYTKGMRPYVFSRNQGQGWHQAGDNVKFQRKGLRYHGFQSIRKYTCLSFQYKFTHQHDEVSFAFSIPYSYSYLLSFLNQLQALPNSKGNKSQQICL